MTDGIVDPGEVLAGEDSPVDTEVVAEAVVIAVTDDDTSGMDPDQLDALAQSGRSDLRQTIVALQQELDGIAKTGVPGVDEAMARLADLDPDDLGASADVLTEVLAKLESVMNETPPE
ncbi:MAG: hypothetical protein V9E98_12395 [Candidatus Nanopelagicales bacterium]